MSSVESLREFVNERLTAAAEQIFRLFKNPNVIVEDEEEIDRQRRLSDIDWKPEIQLHMTGVYECNHFNIINRINFVCRSAADRKVATGMPLLVERCRSIPRVACQTSVPRVACRWHDVPKGNI